MKISGIITLAALVASFQTCPPQKFGPNGWMAHKLL
jgi:hypothetical protein